MAGLEAHSTTSWHTLGVVENDEQYSDVKERLEVRLSSFHEAVLQDELALGRGLNGNFGRFGSVLRNEARLA